MSGSLDTSRAFLPADLDQDGLVDFYNLSIAPDGTTTVTIAWNRSSQFTAQTFTGLPSNGREVPGFVQADLGSDGRPDLMRIGIDVFDSITLTAPSNRITEQRNGVGGRIDIGYGTSAGTTGNLRAGSLMPVVTTVTVSDDTTNSAVDAIIYAYNGGYFDYAHRQLLGFTQHDAFTSRARTHDTYVMDGNCGPRLSERDVANLGGATLSRLSNTFQAMPTHRRSSA